MKISFENFKNQSKHLSDNKLFCLISGIRGAGKSTVIGTLGVPTLLIASTLESHAIIAAKALGGKNITSVLYDVGDNNEQLSPDESLEKLNKILDFLCDSKETLENYQCIALDSVSAIDKTLLETTMILKEKNAWAQMDLLEQIHLSIIKKLKQLHRRGLHILATMPILASFDSDGLYISAKPEIRGLRTTSNIAGNFSDILVVARYANEHIFQMDLLLTKKGKDSEKKDKEISFHPRINGLSHQDLVAIAGDSLLLAADLNYIYQLKLAKQKSKDEEEESDI